MALLFLLPCSLKYFIRQIFNIPVLKMFRLSSGKFEALDFQHLMCLGFHEDIVFLFLALPSVRSVVFRAFSDNFLWIVNRPLNSEWGICFRAKGLKVNQRIYSYISYILEGFGLCVRHSGRLWIELRTRHTSCLSSRVACILVGELTINKD